MSQPKGFQDKVSPNLYLRSKPYAKRIKAALDDRDYYKEVPKYLRRAE